MVPFKVRKTQPSGTNLIWGIQPRFRHKEHVVPRNKWQIEWQSGTAIFCYFHNVGMDQVFFLNFARLSQRFWVSHPYKFNGITPQILHIKVFHLMYIKIVSRWLHVDLSYL